MHVALFSPAWPLRTYPNGIVTYVHWMRDALQRAGHRVSIFATEVGDGESGVERVGRSLRFRTRRWWRSRLQPGYERTLDWGHACADAVLAVHRRDPVDVIEMEESFGWFADVGRRTRIPVVVKLHGPAFMSLVGAELDTPFARAKIAREGAALRAAAVITSPARRTLDDTIAHYRLAPTIGRHVVNPLELPPGAPVWSLDRCERKTLLFVGRFDARKGGDLMIEAFARLAASDPDLRLVFVGPDGGVPGEDRRLVGFEAFRAARLPGAADRVEYRGRLGAEEICALRARAFATVVPSRWENQSYTALEAMLQGCPVVSSDAGGQPESVQHGVTGLLHPAGDAGALADRLADLLRDPERAAALGGQARRHALEHHAPERVASQTVAVYQQAIGLARRGTSGLAQPALG